MEDRRGITMLRSLTLIMVWGVSVRATGGLAETMIREARGEPEAIIARIDRATQEELRSCRAWSNKQATQPRNGQVSCPINSFHSHVALDNTRGDKTRAKYSGRVFVPPRGWGLPRDAIHLCAFIATLQRAGKLPRDASAVRAANLTLLDIGAAFGGETVVGGELGFGVVAFEPHPAEWARLHNAWGGRPQTQIINAAVTRVPSNMTLLAAGDSSTLEERSMHNAQAAQGKARREGLGRVTVRGVSIDADLRQVTTIDPAHVAVIKLDIQGHEYEALAGAIKTIRENHPVLYFEYSPHLFKGAHEADVNKVLCLAMLVGGYKCTIPLRGELAFCVPNSLGRNTRVLHPDADVQRPYSSGARNIPRYH